MKEEIGKSITPNTAGESVSGQSTSELLLKQKFDELSVEKKREYLHTVFGTVRGVTGAFHIWFTASISDYQSFDISGDMADVVIKNSGAYLEGSGRAEDDNSLVIIFQGKKYESESVRYFEKKRINEPGLDYQKVIACSFDQGNDTFTITVQCANNMEKVISLKDGKIYKFEEELIKELQLPTELLSKTQEQIKNTLQDKNVRNILQDKNERRRKRAKRESRISYNDTKEFRRENTHLNKEEAEKIIDNIPHFCMEDKNGFTIHYIGENEKPLLFSDLSVRGDFTCLSGLNKDKTIYEKDKAIYVYELETLDKNTRQGKYCEKTGLSFIQGTKTIMELVGLVGKEIGIKEEVNLEFLRKNAVSNPKLIEKLMMGIGMRLNIYISSIIPLGIDKNGNFEGIVFSQSGGSFHSVKAGGRVGRDSYIFNQPITLCFSK